MPQLLAPPPELLDILEQTQMICDRTSRPLSITLRDDLTQDILVPLAAVLLDFPVAYVPVSAEQTSFLSGVPLDVYECFMHGSGSHTVLKFSSPCSIGARHPELGPERLIIALKAYLQPRLDKVGWAAPLDVVHRIETLDRVAL